MTYGRPKGCSILLTIWSSLIIGFIRIPISRRPLLFSGILLAMGIASMTYFSIGMAFIIQALLNLETQIPRLCGSWALIGFPKQFQTRDPRRSDWGGSFLRRLCRDMAFIWWLNFILTYTGIVIKLMPLVSFLLLKLGPRCFRGNPKVGFVFRKQMRRRVRQRHQMI